MRTMSDLETAISMGYRCRIYYMCRECNNFCFTQDVDSHESVISSMLKGCPLCSSTEDVEILV